MTLKNSKIKQTISSNPTWGEVWHIVTDQIDLVLKQQLLAHKWAKNIRAGGDFAEVHFRDLLRKVLPERLLVTSGHIVAPGKGSEPIVSPQCDIIVVDKMVPHSLLPFRSNEVEFDVVPIESVVAIFETKSNLKKGNGKNSLFSACSHLKNIAETISLPMNYTEGFFPGGMKLNSGNGLSISGGNSANPFLGILAGKASDGFNFDNRTENYLKKIVEEMKPFRLDIVISADGSIITSFDEKGNFLIDPARKLEFKELKVLKIGDTLSRSQIVARGIAIILTYLQNTVGRHYNPVDYLFF